MGFVRRVRREHRRYQEDPNLLHNEDLHCRILETWKQGSPQFHKDLVAAGVAEEAAFVAQQRMWEERDRLVAAGWALTDAREQAERNHLMLGPDLPEQTEGEKANAERVQSPHEYRSL